MARKVTTVLALRDNYTAVIKKAGATPAPLTRMYRKRPPG